MQKILPLDFASAVLRALETGASKAVNILIYGATTSAKSWILDPLRDIFRCHLTPPHKSGFPLQDLPSKEVILWQDFRVMEEVIPWANVLLLFEGTEVTIRRPRTEFLGDQDFKVCQPVFITSGAPLYHPDPQEMAMMERRFKFFRFAKTLPASQVRKVPPCGHCFASLWLAVAAPPPQVPLVVASELPSSQNSSSGDSGLPRSASASSTELPFCEHCGFALLSSPFCRATGRRHC